MKKKQIKTGFTVGIDLGGTKLLVGLVGPKGEVVDQIKVPVEMNRENSASRTQKRILTLMADLIFDLKRRFPKEFLSKNFHGVGLASAGPLDTQSGKLINPSNFPGWKVVPIRENLKTVLKKRKFPVDVAFQNDAIAAALAEGWVGGAKKLKSFAVITVGTGIGSGVIFQGQPCHTNGMGSEFGNSLVHLPGVKADSQNGHKYTVEGLASGTGLLRRAHELGFTGSSVEQLVMAYQNGEKKYQALFEDMAWALAALCYNLSIGFNVEKILFSGGLLKIKDLYFPQTQKHYVDLLEDFNVAFKTPIQIAKCGTDAGLIGAAYLPYL